MKNINILLFVVCLAGNTMAQNMPGFPSMRPGKTVDNTPVAGTLQVSTEVPCHLLLNGDTVAWLTPYHQVIIYSNPLKQQSLAFRVDESLRVKTIAAGTMEYAYIKLKHDTTIADSAIPGKQPVGLNPKVVTRYLPFATAVSFQFSGGINFNGGGTVFQGKFIAGYCFNPTVRLGIGSGWVNTFTHITGNYIPVYYPDKPSYEYSSFNFSYIPLFLDFSARLLKKRVSPFISFAAGVSFPLTKSASGKTTTTDDYGSETEYYEITRFNTGFYMNMTVGMKCFVSNVIDLGVALGYEASINKITGEYNYSGYSGHTETQTNPHVSSGFHIDLILGINLASKHTQKLPE
jgi:hypothetical protein